MPYPATAWVNDAAPDIDAAHLNNIETGISKAPYGPDFSANNAPVWNGSAWVAQKIFDAQIDPAAAIAASKLAGFPSDASKALRGDGSWSRVFTLLDTSQPFKVQFGTSVGTTNGSGQLTIVFPSAFPTAAVTVLVVNGDTGAFGTALTGVQGLNTTQFLATGGPVSAAVRVNWIAIGY